MIRYIYLFSCSLFCFLLGGCFDDEGNYTYKDVTGPNWLTEKIYVTCYEGESVAFDAHKYFKWEKDSALKEANVKYEWALNQKTFATEAEFEIDVADLIKLSDDPFSDNGTWGTLSITDETGVPYMKQVLLVIKALRTAGDWIVLSDAGDHSKLSLFKRRQQPDGDREVSFEFQDDDIFQWANESYIPGHPIGLARATAANVGPLGATTIMTDKVSYVVNNVDMKKVSELKDEFLDGVPENLNIVDRRDSEQSYSDNYTFLATADGRLFRRKMDPNYLGGKFLAEPYVVDSKGCKIVQFGYNGVGQAPVPCYDEKNRRVVINMFKTESGFKPGTWDWYSYLTNVFVPVTKGNGRMDNLPPVWEMPEGTDVLFLTSSQYRTDISYYSASLFIIFYNDKAGNTYMGDFTTAPGDNACLENEKLKVIPFPGGNLDKDSKFLVSIDSRGPQSVILYSKGNEIRYINRERDDSDDSLLTFGSKVTCMSYAVYAPGRYDVPYVKLVVGLEDGTLAICDITNRKEAKIDSQYNLGGKIVSVKELGNRYSGDAY